MAYYVTEERNDALEHAGFKYIKKLPIGGGKFRYIYDKEYGKGYDKKFGGTGKYGIYRRDYGPTRETLSVEKGKGLLGTRTVKQKGNQRIVTVRTGRIEQGIDKAKNALTKTGRSIKRTVKRKVEDATGVTAKKQYQKAKQANANATRDLEANKSKQKQIANESKRLKSDQKHAERVKEQARLNYKDAVSRHNKETSKIGQYIRKKGVTSTKQDYDAKAAENNKLKDKISRNETDRQNAVRESVSLASKKRQANTAEKNAKAAYEKSLVGKIDKFKKENPSMKELLNDTERVTSKRTVLRTSDKQLGEKTKWSNESGTAHKRLKDTINKGEASAKSSNKSAKQNANKAAKAFTNKNYEDGLKYVTKAIQSKANAAGASATTALNKAKYNATVKERETERYGVVHTTKKKKPRK